MARSPTAETVLSIYGDPAVAASADGCEIDPATLLDQDKTLSLVAPAFAPRTGSASCSRRWS